MRCDHYTAMRHYSPLDQIISQFDSTLRTMAGSGVTTSRHYPADDISDSDFDNSQKKQIAGLMRVNHSGEVSAQALYQGQAVTAKDPVIREKLQEAAIEENDHLQWTHLRLHELGSHASVLNPLWYGGSFALGAFAGVLGDKWSLGFLAETEHQVVKHLSSHLEKLPINDARSRAILEQMKIDESKHATTAIDNGAAELPFPVKKLMAAMSKVMTTSSYYI